MSEGSDNIIYVEFGKDGSHRRIVHKKKSDNSDKENHSQPKLHEPYRAPGTDPIHDVYRAAEVAQLFEIDIKQLHRWTRKGLVRSSMKRGRFHLYTFQDLISIRVAKELLKSGISEKDVMRAIESLRATLPKVVRPLTEMRVVADGHCVIVRDEEGAYDPVTGQQVLNFSVDVLREDIVRTLYPHDNDQQHRTAYQYYLEGCRLDEDDQTVDQALQAYLKALEIDPSLACAYTNLGNLYYRLDEIVKAQSYYERALELDPKQPEAYYNLGFIKLTGSDAHTAISYFQKAIEYDYGFADAHFNLAMAYEEIAKSPEAVAHWRIYLDLDPNGEWSDIARKYLSHM